MVDKSEMNILSEIEPFIPAWIKYLVSAWGLNKDFARKAAALICLLPLYRIRFTITSGYRSVQQQKELYAAWLAGTPGVFTPAKPGKSLHNNTTWLGQKDSLALDIDASNPRLAGNIAKALGLYWAGDRDPVHFSAVPG